MKIFVDIDNTICKTGSRDGDNPFDYEDSQPIPERIELINSLFDKGHDIIYWTARGSSTGNDYSEITVSQLDQWGAKRNGVIFGKPSYDIYIDDKSVNSENFFKIFESI